MKATAQSLPKPLSKYRGMTAKSLLAKIKSVEIVDSFKRRATFSSGRSNNFP